MAASSSSSSGLGKTSKGPQVFLNFRGEELRKTFIADLEFALEEANINYFIDKHEQVGTNLKNLLVRIEQSKVALAIFSKEYTTSVWCLDELVKIRECMDKGSLIGIPIFYKLKTSVVSNLEGDFGDNFRKLKRNNQQDLVRTQNWEKALTSIPETIGMQLSEYSDQYDRDFIKSIVKRVKSLLDNISSGEKANQKRQQVNNQYSMIYARSMEIEHSDNPKNWTWSSIYEPPNEVAIEIATLNEVYWMDLRGEFSTRRLTPDTKYEVVFVVKLEQIANGWEEPVNLTMKLIMRDNSEILQEKTLYLDDVCVDDEWVDVKAGDFVAPPKDAPAKIYFKMCQYDDKIRKTGLVVKGVALRAVK